MAQQNMVCKSMPQIELDCLKSMTKYIKKADAYFEFKENEYALIIRRGISLRIHHNDLHSIIINSNYDENKKEYISEIRYSINSVPKEYHYLYWLLYKIIKKIRKKTIKYTIIRTRELDKNDMITCLVSLSGSYTIHFKTGIAYLNDKNCDIKFIVNNTTKTIPFQYCETNTYATRYDDSYDKTRIIVHELIRCADIVKKQKIEQQNYAKTWIIRWNADSGSVEDIHHETQKKESNRNKFKGDDEEGLFRCRYESETTLSSDYSDSNSEMSYTHLTQFAITKTTKNKNTEKNDKLLSVVQEIKKQKIDSSFGSVKSEASWRKRMKQKKNKTSFHLNNNNDDDEDDDLKKNDFGDEDETEQKGKERDNLYLDKIMKWTKKDVCCWLKKKNFSRLICSIFWNYKVDGNKLIKLTSNHNYHISKMFDSIDSVSIQDKKKLIDAIYKLQNIPNQYA